MTRQFETGATRDSDETKLDYEGFIAPIVWQRYAEYMHECRLRNIPEGQTIRGSSNWQLGIPREAYIKSLIRHVMQAWIDWRDGMVDEATWCAILFNAQGMLFETIKERR